VTPDLTLVLLTAASIGALHTVLGPDHYLPFVALSKARNWSLSRTAAITAACGAGHVAGSVVIGAIGIAAGAAAGKLVLVESLRSEVAAWLLFGFGLAYLAWGVKRALRGSSHSHAHVHADGTRHTHSHNHRLAPHVHLHARPSMPTAAAGDLTFTPVSAEPAPMAILVTPWTLFLIFVFGPCEPLIPVLMYPAARADWAAVAAVCVAFALATIGTMLVTVLSLRRGLDALGARVRGLERWSHAIAGATLSVCAAAVMLLGL
jgi:sulfite exporter TauE/SafE